MISIIIPTKDRPDRLKRALQSIDNQTFTDYEVLVVNDGGEDVSQVVEDFKAQGHKAKYWDIPASGGFLGVPRNYAIKKAKGDLIAFLDDDNEFKRDHLQALYLYKQKSGADIVYGDRILIDDEVEKPPRPGIAMEFNQTQLNKTNFIDTSDVLMDKKTIDAVGGWNESIPKFADWDLFTRLANAGFTFQRVAIPLTEYHIHKGMNQMKHKVKQNPDGSLNPTFFDPYNSYWNWKDDRPKPKVAVYTITWNRLDLTKKMYKSLKETADYDFKWFVIDNGSEDDTDKWVVEDKKAECLISNEHNEGISKASNTIVDEIKKGDFDIVVKVDNDAEFRTKGWLKAIVDLWQHNKKLALSPRVEGLIDNPGGVTRRNYVTIANEFMGITYHVGGICIATDISAYKDFKWDEASFKHAEQDVIFSEHLLQRGFIIAYMENYIIEHMGKKGDKKYDEQWQKARQEKPYHMGNGNPELRQDGSSISSPLPPRA